AEVEADADDLARPGDRRSEPCGRIDPRRGGAVARDPLPQLVEPAAGEERLVVVGRQRPGGDPGAVLELDAGRLGAGRAEANQFHAMSVPSPRAIASVEISRMRYFCTFPVTVIGNSVTNRTKRGILKVEICPRQNRRMSSAVTSWPSCSRTHA